MNKEKISRCGPLYRIVLLAGVILFAVSLSVFADTGAGPAGNSPGTVTISYRLNKIDRIASNQLAVWVEDDRGKYIDTIFVTRFTAGGGYKQRPDTLPEWIDVMRWGGFESAEINALSSPTPAAGFKELSWDCTDTAGAPVPDGIYIIKIEGNVFWQHRVIWKCTVEVGPHGDRGREEVFFVPVKTAEFERLLEDVAVIFEPK